MKRRVMIAKAMVHDPDILFLDEPTAGVDTELRENLWKMVSHLRDHENTAVCTTSLSIPEDISVPILLKK